MVSVFDVGWYGCFGFCINCLCFVMMFWFGLCDFGGFFGFFDCCVGIEGFDFVGLFWSIWIGCEFGKILVVLDWVFGGGFFEFCRGMVFRIYGNEWDGCFCVCMYDCWLLDGGFCVCLDNMGCVCDGFWC